MLTGTRTGRRNAAEAEPSMPEHAVSIADKVRFLSQPSSYAHGPIRVEVRETHMSWLFLTGSLVFKLKKPVIYPFLDFSTLAARLQNCRAELDLNRRLAGDVYRRLVALRRLSSGELTLAGEGEIVDWMVEMTQLPERDMLESRIKQGRVTRQEVTSVGNVLSQFYRTATPRIADGERYLAHLQQESLVNRRVLLQGDLGLAMPSAETLLDRVDWLLARALPQIKTRIAAGRIVEGHGDLRPEHVCLQQPPVIIDCLEFDQAMRILDPYDEMYDLGMECALLGADWIGPQLISALDRLGWKIEDDLLHTYGAFRAVLRARLSLAHLLDPAPATPERWRAKARTYLHRAEQECVSALG